MERVQETSGVFIFTDRFAASLIQEGDYPLVEGKSKRVVSVDIYRTLVKIELSDGNVVTKDASGGLSNKHDQTEIELWLKRDAAVERVARGLFKTDLVAGYVREEFADKEPDTHLEVHVDNSYTCYLNMYEKCGYYFLSIPGDCLVYSTEDGVREKTLELVEGHDFRLVKDSHGLFAEKSDNSRLVTRAI